MTKFTFIGCSITRGEGLFNKESDEKNYANIVGKRFNATVKNLSKSGNSNYNIFISGLNELLYDKPDMLLLQWSGLQRHWLYPNLDIEFPIVNDIVITEINYLQTVFSKKFLTNFVEQFLLLNHDYYNILALLNYCKILETIAQEQTRLVFINGLIPWTEEIQYKQSIKDPMKNFSKYTKDLLSINMLSDEDIVLFFDKIYNALDQIDKNKWPNMFQSLADLQIDYGIDNMHPGSESHKKIADIIINHINK